MIDLFKLLITCFFFIGCSQQQFEYDDKVMIHYPNQFFSKKWDRKVGVIKGKLLGFYYVSLDKGYYSDWFWLSRLEKIMIEKISIKQFVKKNKLEDKKNINHQTITEEDMTKSENGVHINTTFRKTKGEKK